jgi:hypothetical protein
MHIEKKSLFSKQTVSKNRKTTKAEILSLVAPAPHLTLGKLGKIWVSKVDNMNAPQIIKPNW